MASQVHIGTTFGRGFGRRDEKPVALSKYKIYQIAAIIIIKSKKEYYQLIIHETASELGLPPGYQYT